jgi:phosphate/sulfate permease
MGFARSSFHALVGGLLRAGVAALGLGGINWHKVILVFASLLVPRSSGSSPDTC